MKHLKTHHIFFLLSLLIFLALFVSQEALADNWTSPTGHNDPDSKWFDEAKAYDGDTGTYAFCYYSNYYLELTIDVILCDKVQIYAAGELMGAVDPDIDIDVYYDGAWHNIHSGVITKQTWVEKAIGSTQSVTKARVRGNVTGSYYYIYEFQFNEVPPPPCNPPISGDYVMTESCIFPSANTIHGVEGGHFTIKSGATLTINSGYTIVWNPGKSVIIEKGGSIAINKGTPGGQLRKAYIYMDDADSDGWPDNFTMSWGSSESAPAGKVRRADLAANYTACPTPVTYVADMTCGPGRWFDTNENCTSTAAGNYSPACDNDNLLCTTGHYCPGATDRIPCAAGYYGATTGLETSNCSGLCDAGYYGNATGTIVSTCTGLCAAGRYGTADSVRTTSDCTDACAAGRYGLADTVRTTDQCDGPCQAGYYCEAGSTTSTQAACDAHCKWSNEGATSSESCIPATAGTDPWGHCGAVTCSDYLYGWADDGSRNCLEYATSTANNGMCDGAEACYGVTDSCGGEGNVSVYVEHANCVDWNKCVVGSEATGGCMTAMVDSDVACGSDRFGSFYCFCCGNYPNECQDSYYYGRDMDCGNCSSSPFCSL